MKLKEKEDEEKRKLINNYVTKVQKSAPLKDEEKPVVDLLQIEVGGRVYNHVAVRKSVFVEFDRATQGAGSGSSGTTKDTS